MPTIDRLKRGQATAAAALLAEASAAGHWEGELSSSPLSTATAIVALQLAIRARPDHAAQFQPLIDRGLQWLANHQNQDGGWGDTVLSYSNISTSMLVYASFRLTSESIAQAPSQPSYSTIVERAAAHVEHKLSLKL